MLFNKAENPFINSVWTSSGWREFEVRDSSIKAHVTIKRARIAQMTRIYTYKILFHNLQSSCFQQNKNLCYLRSKNFLDCLCQPGLLSYFVSI